MSIKAMRKSDASISSLDLGNTQSPSSTTPETTANDNETSITRQVLTESPQSILKMPTSAGRASPKPTVHWARGTFSR